MSDNLENYVRTLEARLAAVEAESGSRFTRESPATEKALKETRAALELLEARQNELSARLKTFAAKGDLGNFFNEAIVAAAEPIIDEIVGGQKSLRAEIRTAVDDASLALRRMSDRAESAALSSRESAAEFLISASRNFAS
jgi:hypothetical protein